MADRRRSTYALQQYQGRRGAPAFTGSWSVRMRPLAVTILMLCWAGLAHAEPLPSFLNSNDTERRLPTSNLPVDAYRPGAPGLQVPAPAAAQQQPLLMSTQVQVRKVRFEGGTVYPLGELREHYQPVIGHTTSLAALIDLTRRLTQRYQDDGYLLSYAYLPPQDFADGRVRVVLVEGTSAIIRSRAISVRPGPMSNACWTSSRPSAR